MSAEPETIRQSYRYALAPTAEQEAVLRSWTGAARFWFNRGLALVKDRLNRRAAGEAVRVPWSYWALCSEFPASERNRVAPWQREVPCGSYMAGFEALGRALQSFSEAKRAGRRVGFPRFRSKGRSPESVIFQRPRIRDSRHVELDRRLGALRTRESLRKLTRLLARDPKARIVRATLTRTPAGRWFVCFQVERSAKSRRARMPDAAVGVDLGLRHLASLSTGEGVENPRPLTGALRRLRRLQRHLDRQRRAANPGNYLPDGRVKPGAREWRRSKRMVRTEERIRRLHERVANLRRESVHQLTSYLTREFGVIGVESLNVAGMLRDRRIARSLSDAALGRILRQLEYKASWSDVTLVAAGRFYPSSKTCSACREVKTKLSRAETVFACENCGLRMDRDQNAALNLAKLAVEVTQAKGRRTYLAPTGGERQNARGGQVSPVPGDGRSPEKREGSPSGESSRLREESALAAH